MQVGVQIHYRKSSATIHGRHVPLLSATWYICSYPASYARTLPVIPRTSSRIAHVYDVRGRCALLCSDVLCCWLCSIMCYTVTNYRLLAS